MIKIVQKVNKTLDNFVLTNVDKK